jgi:PAS domain S-box-containing protein
VNQGKPNIYIWDGLDQFPILKTKLEHLLGDDSTILKINSASNISRHASNIFILIGESNKHCEEAQRNLHLATQSVYNIFIYQAKKEANELPVFYECLLSHLQMGELVERIRWATSFGKQVNIEEDFKPFLHSPIATVILDTQGYIINHNKEAESVFGDTISLFSNTPFTENITSITDLDGNKVPKEELTLYKSIKKKQAIKGNKRIVTLNNGSTKILNVSSTPILKNNEVEFAIVTFEDISSLIAHQQEIKQFKLAIDSAFSGMVITDLNGKITYANKKMIEQWGYRTADEIIGKETHTFWENSSHAKENMEKLLHEGFMVDELNALRKDGSTFRARLSTNIIQDKTGKPIALLGWCNDISEEYEFRESFKQNLDQQKVVSELSTDYIYSLKTSEGKSAELEWVSGAFKQITGYQPEDINKLPNNYYSIIHEDDERILNELRPEKLKSDSYKLVYRIKTKNNETKWLEDQFLVTRNEKTGKAIKIVGAVRDISLEKDIQTALQESESRNRKLVELLPVAIIIHSENKITYVNPAVLKIFGGSTNDYLGKPVLDLVHPEFKEIATKRIKRIYDQKEYLPAIEEKLITIDRKVIIGEIHALPFKFQGKSSSLVVIRDITQQHEFETRLKEERDKAENYLNITGSIIVVIDNNQNIRLINDRGTEVLGYNQDEIYGKNWFDTFTPEEVKENLKSIFNDLMQVNESESQSYEYKSYENEIIIKGGDKKLIRWNNRIIFDSTGKAIGTISSGEDITELKAYQNELIRAKNKAEEAGKLKSAFLANMSHEVRTPMNGILGFTQMLRDPNIERSKMEGYIEIIHKSSQQLLTIINDIVDISKIEAGQIEMYPEEVDIHKLLDELKLFYKPNTKSRGIELKLYKDRENEAISLSTDPVRLKQIMNNLINNAIKFTRSGYVKFGYRLRSSVVIFFVEDTGIGIGKEHQELIFDRFRQVEMDATRNFGGTGLGLSISKALVEKLNGSIWVNSEPNKGSTFFVSLPYKNTPTKEKEEPLIDEEFIDLVNKKILIAEDEKINYLYLSELLMLTNATLLHATNGKEALELFEKNPDTDLILMDIKMPILDGHEAAKLLKTQGCKAPIIAQTAYAMSGDKLKALNSGCDDYIAKPIRKENLMQLLHKYIG